MKDIGIMVRNSLIASYILVEGFLIYKDNNSFTTIYSDINHDGITDMLMVKTRLDDNNIGSRCIEGIDTLYGARQGGKTVFLSPEEFKRYNK